MPEESTNLQNESPAKDYLVVVQCDIVKERCSGYHCEKAFYERSGHFSHYPKEQNTRVLYLTCGGCCGRSLLRKLSHLVRRSQKKENLRPEKMIVKFASCIAKENYHGPLCPHLDYMKDLVERAGMDFEEGTVISPTAERKRAAGCYQ